MSIEETLNRFWELWHSIEESAAHHANWLDWFDERVDGCGVHGMIYGNSPHTYEDEMLFRFENIEEGIERLAFYLTYADDVEERLRYIWELWDDGVRVLTQQVLYPEVSCPGGNDTAMDHAPHAVAA